MLAAGQALHGATASAAPIAGAERSGAGASRAVVEHRLRAVAGGRAVHPANIAGSKPDQGKSREPAAERRVVIEDRAVPNCGKRGGAGGSSPGWVMTAATLTGSVPPSTRSAWARVSAVAPDFEMTRNPVRSRSDPLEDAIQAVAVSVAQEEKPLVVRSRSPSSAWPPRLAPPVPSTTRWR